MQKTISDILSSNRNERDALAPYANWTLDHYIAYWEDVDRRGGRVPKAFSAVLQRALLDVLENGANVNSPHYIPKVELLPEVFDIELSDLLYYFTEKGDSISINRLRSGGVATIGELMTASYTDLQTIPYIGASTLRRALRYKRWLTGHQQHVIDEYHLRSLPYLLPPDYQPTQRLLKVMREVLIMSAELLSLRADDPRFARTPRDTAGMHLLSAILSARYNEELSFNEIAERLDRTPWHITKTHADFIALLCRGGCGPANLQLHPELLKRVRRVQEDALFRRDRVFGNISGIDSTLINILGMDIIKVNNGLNIVIPARELCRYTARTRAVLRTLRKFVSPVTGREIYDALADTKEFEQKITPSDRRFVDSLLHEADFVETFPDGRIILRLEHYVSDEQRIARIIIEDGGWLTRAEIFDRFRLLMNRESNSVNLSNLRKFQIYSSGDLWIYGLQLPPINHFISDWTRRRRIFHLPELEQALTDAGYPLLSRIRAYVTTDCLVDNVDPNHFCHKEATDYYPEYNWRRPGRSGLSNWILLQMKDLAGTKEGMDYESMMAEIERRARREDKDCYIRQRVKSTLSAYSGTGKPFLVEENRVRSNPDVFPSVNFSTLGRRGHHRSEEFERLRQFAVTTLRATPAGSVTLVEFLRIMADHGLGHINRNSCLRALTSAHLSPIPVETVNIGGSLHLRLTDRP